MASMAVNEISPMLTATEVAEMLHLHVNTVKRLGDRGELPFYRVCKRGDRRFRMETCCSSCEEPLERRSSRPGDRRPDELPARVQGAAPHCAVRSRGGVSIPGRCRGTFWTAPEDIDRLSISAAVTSIGGIHRTTWCA